MKAKKTTKTIDTITLEMTINQAKLLHTFLGHGLSGISADSTSSCQFFLDVKEFVEAARANGLNPNDLRDTCTSKIWEALGYVLNG